MKQALRVAFGFLMLWAAMLHAEVRIVIDGGVDSGRPIGVVPLNGQALVLHQKISVVLSVMTCATAVNLIRLIALVCHNNRLLHKKFSQQPGLHWLLTLLLLVR